MSVDTVSIVFICLRDYNVFFDRFYDSCEKLFLKDVEKKYFVITDHGRDFLEGKDRVTYCQVRTPKHVDSKGRRRVDKRAIKLNKFNYIDRYWNQIRNSDYIFYFDADSVVRKTVKVEDVIDENKRIVGVVHGFSNIRSGKGRKGIRFEGDPKSSAYVDPEKYDVSVYYQSCLWGGKPNDVRSMVDDIQLWIEKDLEIGHKNKYNICDEVYVNKYFVLNKEHLKELDGRYSCPSEGIAYRRHNKDYDGGKEIIIAHDCSAQNHTERKFKKMDQQSKPIAFHFNGKASFKKYSEEEISALNKIIDSNSNKNRNHDCEIFTFDNNSSSGMFIDSCNRLKVPVVNLGEEKLFSELRKKYPAGEQWKEVSDIATRKAGLKGEFLFMHKLLGLYHYLKTHKTQKYISFFDQSDTMLIDHPSERLELFKSKGCGMLFNAESKCMYWPMVIRRNPIYPKVNKYLINYGDVKLFEEETYGEDCYESNGYKLCYLNSGGFMADRDYYISFFDKYIDFMLEIIHYFDQTVMHHFHFCYYPEIMVDHKCEVFQCMGPNKIDFRL
jgi:hypothetical protein